ncbi:MAG TPA: flagellar basal-body MS-ring/collar protein FliF [Acetobacteraceae bacterium]|nr:flagellar basal-body MS-ring/collar protein FliF [Acetobacteraceae bacterium]
MKALVEGLRALGPARLAAMGAVALGMLGMLALMVLRGGTEPMALLYGDLDLRDSSQVVDQLARRHIPYRIAANGSQVLVPAEQVAEARVALAREGLPAGGSVGYEIFDRSDGLAATEFQQKINETRALEGEIARTIRAMQGIRGVRVHLVLPEREPFARERRDAQASVMLTMAGVGRLDREGIQAILNLVAAAVPALRPQNIAIVDSRGDLLARAGEPVGPTATALSTEEVRRATELRLARAVEEMLERSLGAGHVRAEAAVRMSFDRLNETQEHYDPDGQVTRSSQTVNSNSKSTEPNGTVTVQNNLPNADAGRETAGSQEGRQEETTNYEISKTVRTLIREQPQIDRISLAVMVDGTDSIGADGKHVWQPRAAEELDRITGLVRSAIGYDEKRGDHVEVVSMRFTAEDAGTVADNSGLLGLQLDKADLLHLAQTALFGAIGVLALLLVLRPMVLRITSVAPASVTGGGTVLASLAGPAAPALPGPTTQAIASSGSPAMLEDESMVNIAQIEGQMRASSLRRIGALVEKHPEETLSIVRGWMVQENN